jgi:hypothetical protein
LALDPYATGIIRNPLDAILGMFDIALHWAEAEREERPRRQRRARHVGLGEDLVLGNSTGRGPNLAAGSNLGC